MQIQDMAIGKMVVSNVLNQNYIETLSALLSLIRSAVWGCLEPSGVNWSQQTKSSASQLVQIIVYSTNYVYFVG